MIRSVVLGLGLALAALSLWRIEDARPVVASQEVRVGVTPVTYWAVEDPIATVIVAHGFAGSRRLMTAYAWTLVRNGYAVAVFDFEGHGTHPTPMSGDVNAIDGTTRLLVAQTQSVMDRFGPAPALLGHSMATDVIVRAAEGRATGPIIAISAFSEAVTGDHPPSLLLIAGQWEDRLVAFGRQAIRQLDPDAVEGEIVGQDVVRMALIAPRVEHVGILHHPFALAESVAWLDAHYGVPPREIEVAAFGWWILGLLTALMLLWWPLSHLLPKTGEAAPVPRGAILASGAAALAVPLLAVWVDLSVLPVLVADYLAVHLGLTGLVQLAILRRFGVPVGPVSVLAVLALLTWGLGVFGLAIDSYAANFHPSGGRWAILAALALGAVPFMVADAVATRGGRGPLWQRLLLRIAFFGSLVLAIALDFERLFFLALIAPVILLFFLIFGLMGRWTADRAGPVSAGLALGLILAWALGVTFPLFEA